MIKYLKMRHSKIVFSACILLFVFNISRAQQVPMYSQYLMNGFLVNPSIAGHDGYSTVNLTVREQWAGMQEAPSTYALSFQTRILKNSYISKSTSVKRKLVRPTKGGRVGVGGYIFNDNNGIMRRTGFQASYAYHIPQGVVDNEYTNDLAFGLSFMMYQYAVNLNKVSLYDPDDPYLNSYDRSVIIPDFNFGVSFTTQKYYVGFSMTNLLRGSVRFGNSGTNKKSTELGHYFLTGSYKVPLADNWVLEPSAFLKASDLVFKSIQLDLTSRVYYKNDYWAGLSWRTNDAMILLLGLKYDKFYFGYAFDYALTEIRKETFGSHEFTLAVKFGTSARRYRWINAF